jgi:hypothetical protein
MHARCDVSGLVCGVVGAVDILENYASYVGGCLPTLRYRLLLPYSSVLDCLTIEDETDRLTRNVRRNYQCTLSNLPENRRPLIHDVQGGSNMTGTCAACLHTNQSRSYLNHLVFDMFCGVLALCA